MCEYTPGPDFVLHMTSRRICNLGEEHRSEDTQLLGKSSDVLGAIRAFWVANKGGDMTVKLTISSRADLSAIPENISQRSVRE